MIYDLLCLPIGKSGAKVRFLFEIAMLFGRYFVPAKRITGKMSFFFASAGGMAYRKRGLPCRQSSFYVCAVAAELWLQFIAFLPEPLCPLRVGFGLVEVLVGDGLAYVYLEVLATGGLHHLAGQEDETYVEFHAQFAAYPFKGIEGCGVAAVEVHGHYVALCFHALLYDALLPFYVLDFAVDVARAETGRETYQLGVGVVVGALYPLHVGTFLASHGIDGQEDASEGFDVHEQVVDDNLYLGKEVAEYGYVGYTVEGSQRMVADEHVMALLVKVFHALHGICYLHVLGHGFGKGRPIVMSQTGEYVVHLLLADEALHHAYDEGGKFLP